MSVRTPSPTALRRPLSPALSPGGRKGATLLYICVLGLLLCACPKDIPSTWTEGQIRERLDAAWEQFHTGSYDQAHLSFEEVIKHDASSDEGLLGNGWSLLRAGRTSDAMIALMTISRYQEQYWNAQAALVAAQYAADNTPEVASLATSVLNHAPYYACPFIADYDYHDLRLLWALSAYDAGDFGTAWDQLHSLLPDQTDFPRTDPELPEKLLPVLESAGRLWG